MRHLQQVFEILQANKLFAKVSKCIFALPQLEYLGHVIRGDGVATDPVKIEAIIKWLPPKNATAEKFSWAHWYYSRFIHNYGFICKPLFQSLKKYNFTCGTEQMEAFNIFKHKMTQAHVLALPDFTHAFVLETGACAYDIGVVLMQFGRPIPLFSKYIGPRDVAMSTYDKEALEIIETLQHWNQYFAASSMSIRTNH